MTRTGWLLVLVACLGVPTAAAVVAASVVDPETFKAPLIDAVGEATGRHLSLDGPLRVRWSLWPTLQVNGVRLSNVAGGSRPDMATAERIEAQISLPSLFLRRLEVLRLALTGPNILFEAVDGRGNWILDPLPGPEPGAGDVARPPPAPPRFGLGVRDVLVVNGMVTSRLPARTRVVGLRSLQVHHDGDSGAISLSGTLVYGDNRPFSLRASGVPTAGVHGPWNTSLSFAAYDTAATGVGTMTLAGDYDLQVEARSGALEKLNALLPEMRLPAVHGADLSTHLINGPVLGSLPTVGPARLAFSGADLRPVVPGLTMGKVQASLPAAGGQATVAGQGSYAGIAFTVRGSAGVPLHPDGPASLPIDLAWTAAAGRGTLSAKGRLDVSALGFAGLDTLVSLQAPALAALRPALSHQVPALRDVRFEGQVTVPADAGSVRVRQARLASDAGDLAGDVTLGGQPSTAVAARLRSTRMELDTVLEAFGAGWSSSAASGPGGRLIPDVPLPWATGGVPTADVTAEFGTVTLAGQTLRDLAVTLQSRGGKRVATARMALPGGALQASLSAGVGAVPTNLVIHAPAVPLSVLAAHAGLPGMASGSARLDAELSGNGSTLRQLAASLDGPASITVVEGQISNQGFLKLAAGAVKALGITVPVQGNTELRCLGLVGVFSNGLLTLRTIALESTYLSLSGTGQVDLRNERLALKLHPLARVGSSPVAVPVVVEGPFAAIGGRLDASGLDKLGLLLDGWFGGDKSGVCSAAGRVQQRSTFIFYSSSSTQLIQRTPKF